MSNELYLPVDKHVDEECVSVCETQQRRMLRKTSSSPDIRTEFEFQKSEPAQKKIDNNQGSEDTAANKSKLSSSSESVQHQVKPGIIILLNLTNYTQ